jgi:hypothetical protein
MRSVLGPVAWRAPAGRLPPRRANKPPTSLAVARPARLSRCRCGGLSLASRVRMDLDPSTVSPGT